MLFSTPTQFAVLALLLIAGWFLGLASHPGGRKWKERYLAERDAHAANRKTWDAEHKTLTAQTDERIATAKTGLDDREADHRDRIAELERENERLRTAAPVTAQTVAPRPRAAARPYAADDRKRGWFDFS
ncbi:hypothetical protein [Sphingomonas oligophenolica]|uniref:Uncharacterized protein n=1 Tax=Sphingomonas oligophenolica TaxID=301154 RepID=A0A502CKR3_9SPHN|nr:hypothetical protein [Sphingomonas oligophenolica]TPG13508.1 hypothetical protein EAH84_04705 [Sphingomonas oligophenolica]